MIKSKTGHLQINVDVKNLAFYKELFTFLGWSVLYEELFMLGIASEQGESLWLTAPLKEANNDFDGIGMNHLGIAVNTQEDVDLVIAYLKEHQVAPLFETPRHRPEFSAPGQTYYQVMFETPDRILIEVVYTGSMA